MVKDERGIVKDEQVFRNGTSRGYRWKVVTATLAVPQPSFEPPQLEDMLEELEGGGWEVVTVVSDPAHIDSAFNRVRVIARKPIVGN